MASGAQAAAAPASGLPQFDSSVFASQIFWTVVSFVLLMYLLNKYVIPAIGDILDSRASKISEDLGKAEKSREEAEVLLNSYKNQLSSAREMANATLEEARQGAARYRDEALAELNAELDKKRASALEEIDRAKTKAMGEIRLAAVEVAMMATEKLVAKTVSREDAEGMVQEAMTQIAGQGKGSLH